jgi:hypothetical protein
LGRHLIAARAKLPHWAPAEVKLLGKLPDEELAAKVGHSSNAVRCKPGRGTPARRCGGY